MGLASLVVSAGFYLQWSWATDLWPWPDSRLSYIFLASILAAVALPVIWIGLSGELGAAEAGGLDLAVTYGGMGAYLFSLEQPGLGVYAAVAPRARSGERVPGLLVVLRLALGEQRSPVAPHHAR